jgi:hypothetical protein
MAVTVYSTDDDIVKIRPNILSLGVSDWEEHHQKAFTTINRTLISRWYRGVAEEYDVDWRETEFDPEKVDTDQLLDLACYKTLEYCYMHLMKDAPDPDGFERLMEKFRKLYNEELREILALGINYDWDEDDTIASSEKYQPSQRRLVRV